MARSLRIERSGGVYHVINRGNYRQDLFINDGAHEAFERCLFEACQECGWVLEGFCVMTNHFHLVIRTPNGNLVYGMKWLQATFANRYHRFRKVHGKMCHGWALGTKDFKRKLLETEGLLKDGNTQAIRLEGKELQEANELQWEAILNRGLKILGKDIADVTNERKSASWKVWIASVLKQRSSATNVWIARQLNMGVPQAVTIHVGSLDKVKLRKTKEYQNFIYEFTK